MIKLIEGDITKEYGRCLIAHGVNCQGVMGSGVAKAIRAKWPDVYRRFLEMPTGPEMLGKCDIMKVGREGTYVANCYTQLFFGSDGKRYADLQAVESALDDCFFFCNLHMLTLKAPKIGSGLGGLSWENEVQPIFERLNRKYNVNVEIFYI